VIGQALKRIAKTFPDFELQMQRVIERAEPAKIVLKPAQL
jgi:hypothetical protein